MNRTHKKICKSLVTTFNAKSKRIKDEGERISKRVKRWKWRWKSEKKSLSEERRNKWIENDLWKSLYIIKKCWKKWKKLKKLRNEIKTNK